MNGVWVDAALGVVRRKGWLPLLAAQQRDAPQAVHFLRSEVLLGDADPFVTNAANQAVWQWDKRPRLTPAFAIPISLLHCAEA